MLTELLDDLVRTIESRKDSELDYTDDSDGLSLKWLEDSKAAESAALERVKAHVAELSAELNAASNQLTFWNDVAVKLGPAYHQLETVILERSHADGGMDGIVCTWGDGSSPFKQRYVEDCTPDNCIWMRLKARRKERNGDE